MSPLEVIDKYYADNDNLRRLLLVHSWQVATRALLCAARHPQLDIDRRLVLSGALLHDIGIFETDAPSIYCYGKEPYLMHGFVGARLLRQIGLESEARICERHTGAGLSEETVRKAGCACKELFARDDRREVDMLC